MARIIEKYLKQDLVEEEGAEHAAQILPLRSSLLDCPRMSTHPFNCLLTTKCHNFSWVDARSTNL